jgi:hypothetical protein
VLQILIENFLRDEKQCKDKGILTSCNVEMAVIAKYLRVCQIIQEKSKNDQFLDRFFCFFT